VKIQFVTAKVNLEEMGQDLRSEIEIQLKKQGEPLRWAITAVESGSALIEAVVLQEINLDFQNPLQNPPQSPLSGLLRDLPSSAEPS
jgi:hypothetical protein